MSPGRTIENMVDVAGIEPATPCLQRLVARKINKLAAVCRKWQKKASCMNLRQLRLTLTTVAHYR
jgi:hypothetical protein